MRRAFTLIELLLSVAIGAVIVGSLFAGVRLAASCVTTADRLAVQNQLIAAGILQLSDELDSWRSWDDPDDAARQPLRGPPGAPLDAAGRGAPFCRFADVWSACGIQNAWGEDPERWSAADPRAWWRGCMAERCQGDWRSTPPRFGFYGTAGASVRAGVTPTYAVYGAPPQPTTDSSAWAYDQQNGLYHALGFYGMADYLPANAIFGWYEDPALPPDPNPWPTASGMPCYFLCKGTWDAQAYNRAGAALPAPQSIYQATYNGIFALTAATAVEATADLAQLVNRNRYAWITWEGLDAAGLEADVRDVFRKAESRSTLVPVGPSHWPMVTARMLRSVHKAYFTNLCTVSWIDPITGESSELRFTGFGTTLRGARRGRGLDRP